MSEFEEQLKQEELARLQADSTESYSNLREYRDSDGTLYEWDADKNAWFPKIDADFIAKYQMNYGVEQKERSEAGTNRATAGSTQEYSQEEYDKYWRNYYDYYYYNQQNTEQNAQQEHENAGSTTTAQESNGNEVKANQTNNVSTKERSEDEEDKNSDYYHYFSQYYDENYVPPTTEGRGKADTAQSDPDTSQTQGKKKQGSKVGDKRKPQPDTGWVEIEDEKNTNVYVSGLPLDVTDEEFKELMSKCGIIAPDLHTGEPKFKLYRDESGEPKGDGRCCYIKVESVNLALQILDGSDLRGHKVHVERAKFTMKGHFDPKKRRKKLSAKEKKKVQMQQQKLLDWKPELDDTRKRWEKVVVLKNMFDPKEFEDDPMLINELREDVRTECSKYGEVKKVILYDRHPEGVMTVHFKEFEGGDVCVGALNGRWFAKKRISAETWDGKTKYEVEESNAEREERLKKWSKFLEDDQPESGGPSATAGASMPPSSTEKSEVSESSASGVSNAGTAQTPGANSESAASGDAT